MSDRGSAQDALRRRRDELALALRETQEGVRRTVGMRVGAASWVLPLVAAGLGVTLALALRRRATRKSVSSGSEDA